MANIYYVEKEGFMKRFPPDCIRTIIQNFSLKEMLHQRKLAKLQDEANESLYGKGLNQLNLKTNQILRCLNSPSRAKVAKQLQLSQNKEIESQDKAQFSLSPDLFEESPHQEESTTENSGFFDIKNKLDGFLRNAIQAKAGTSQ